MLEFYVDQKSGDSTVDYMEAVKQKVLQGIREGIAEGMEILAGNTVFAMEASGIQARTGLLEKNILESAGVSEDADVIRGRVSAFSRVKEKGGGTYVSNLGNILDLGFHDPAEKGKTAPMYQFAAANGESAWTHGHKAFSVQPHPFFRRAVEVSEAPIMDVIRSRLAEIGGE